MVGDIQVIASDDDIENSNNDHRNSVSIDLNQNLTTIEKSNNNNYIGLSIAESDRVQSQPQNQLDSLTLSEDSDATRIYDLNSRETKILRHAIIRESRQPIGDATILFAQTPTPPSTPTSSGSSEHLRRSPSFAVDRAIQQLTANTHERSTRTSNKTVGKLKPNLFSESEARLKQQQQRRQENHQSSFGLSVQVPKKVSSFDKSDKKNFIERKMADVEVLSAAATTVVQQQPTPQVEIQTHTQQSTDLETSHSTITNGSSVTLVESATETSKAEHVVNEATKNESEHGVEVKEGCATSTAELVQHKELSTTEDGDRTVVQETNAVASVERNQSDIFTQQSWHPAERVNGDSTTVVNGESASQVSSTEEVHRSESTVVTTEADPENNVTRTITVTTSCVGVKHRILSESAEVIVAAGENLSLADAASLKEAIENGTLGTLLLSSGQTNGNGPALVDQQQLSPQIVSETLKTPIIQSPASESPRSPRAFNYPPPEPVEVIIVSETSMITLVESFLIVMS